MIVYAPCQFMTVISKKCNCRNEIENLIKLGLSILLDYFILIGTMFLFNIWDQKAINYMYGFILYNIVISMHVFVHLDKQITNYDH